MKKRIIIPILLFSSLNNLSAKTPGQWLDEMFDEMKQASKKMHTYFEEARQEVNERVQKLFDKETEVFKDQASPFGLGQGENQITINVDENENVVIKVAASGIDPDTIEASSNGEVLNIKAPYKEGTIELSINNEVARMRITKKYESFDPSTELRAHDRKGGDKSHIKQSSSAVQIITQTLPVPVSLENMKIEYKNEILTISLIKLESTKPFKRVHINK